MSELIYMEWSYLTLTADGRLRDENGVRCIGGDPAFSSEEEASAFLVDQDIRATITEVQR